MEANNMKAMREALSEIVLLTVKAGKSISCDVACGIIASKAKHALAAPPRQCDVGTAEEQTDRYETFCASVHPSCVACKADEQYTKCEFVWAQMPYEESKEGK